MAIARGIQATRGSTARKPTKLESVFPVAMVLTMPTEPKLYYFKSPKDALEYFREKQQFSGGNWERYLDLWEDTFPATIPLLISSAQPNDDAETFKANIIDAINDMKGFGAEFDVRPDVIAVADLPGDKSVLNQLIVVNNFFQSRSWYDIDAKDGSAAQLFRNDFSSERIHLINTSFKKFNTETETTELYDGGVVMAMQRGYLDAKRTYGWFDSASNVPMLMDGAKYVQDYHLGADETDPFADIQVWSVVNDGGLRPWGSDYTCSTDPIWQNGSRVRLVDLAIKAIRKELRDSIDKDLAELSIVKSSLAAFVNKLIGQGILLGGEILLDEEKTTETEITAGNFYFILDFQEMPKARRIVVHMNYTDRYSNIAYKMLEEA